MMRLRLGIVLVAMLFVACSSDTGSEADAANDVQADVVEDTTIDVAEDMEDETTPEVDVQDDEVSPEDVEVVPEFPPRTLPFEYSRAEMGEPLTDEEITDFTKEVTGFWKEVDWFRWVLRTSMGVDASTGMRDYLAWHNDMKAVKEGDTVTLQEHGGEHNMWIPGSKVLTEAINGCALTGDWTICKVAEQYCKGLTAVVVGFRKGEDDPAPWLMARAVFPNDNECVMDAENWKDDGRKKVYEFHHTYHPEDGWNAHKFEWTDNPAWGDIYVTNMRSKDDVCAITRTTTFLPYIVADAPYDWVREACEETMTTMVEFHKDIVDHEYNIRTKDQDGTARYVTEEDLGSYVEYTGVDPNNECPARLATDLIAYQEPRTEDCGEGYPTIFDMLAPDIHYYNYPIVWDYHLAALGNALVYGYPIEAYSLLKGFTKRMNDYLYNNADEPGATHHNWNRDMALLLVKAAAMGFPLNAQEARLVQEHWLFAVNEFRQFPNWDLWDDSVPDGEYSGGTLRPDDSPEGIQNEGITMFLEYCNSPFKNPDSAKFIDCDIVRDVSQWGE